MSNLREVISHCGSVIGNHPFLVEKFLKAADPEDPINPTEDETAAAKTATEEAYMSMAFLSGIKNAMYGTLLKDMNNSFITRHDKYPKTLTSTTWKSTGRETPRESA